LPKAFQLKSTEAGSECEVLSTESDAGLWVQRPDLPKQRPGTTVVRTKNLFQYSLAYNPQTPAIAGHASVSLAHTGLIRLSHA